MAAERPIAEILGWERCPYPGSDGLFSPPGADFYANDSPSVDDMLAWIEAQGCTWQAGPVWNVGRRLIVSGPETDTDGWLRVRGRWDAPTLREALEMAVRAVAGEEHTDG